MEVMHLAAASLDNTHPQKGTSHLQGGKEEQDFYFPFSFVH